MAIVPTVLIVDDQPINLAVLQTILAPQGFRILKARDGPSAREVLAREQADLGCHDDMECLMVFAADKLGENRAREKMRIAELQERLRCETMKVCPSCGNVIP